jgi:Mn2+/Fe2+ NRAMP family transporter
MTPPLLGILLLVANNRDIMGDYVNGTGLNVLGWATTVVMSA